MIKYYVFGFKGNKLYEFVGTSTAPDEYNPGEDGYCKELLEFPNYLLRGEVGVGWVMRIDGKALVALYDPNVGRLQNGKGIYNSINEAKTALEEGKQHDS